MIMLRSGSMCDHSGGQVYRSCNLRSSRPHLTFSRRALSRTRLARWSVWMREAGLERSQERGLASQCSMTAAASAAYKGRPAMPDVSSPPADVRTWVAIDSHR
jgi:hypothetical protein